MLTIVHFANNKGKLLINQAKALFHCFSFINRKAPVFSLDVPNQIHSDSPKLHPESQNYLQLL